MQRVSDMVHRITEVLLLIVLTGMSLVVFLQVLFRYVLNLPLFWTEEFARYCLVWASLLGAAVATKRGQHIAVSFVMERLPVRPRRFLTVVALLSVAVILGIIMWGGIQLVIVTRTQISPALRISMSIPYAAVPVGAAVMLLHTIVLIIQATKPSAEEDRIGS